MCDNDETNSEGCQCDHRGYVHSHPSTIVVDLKNGEDPYKVAEIGLKILGNATVSNASMEQCSTFFDSLCSKAKEMYEGI